MQGGRGWASDITKPEVKTRAINQVKNIKDNTENMIKDLGGKVPPTSNACSQAGKRKRGLFNPLDTVKNLAKDALGLANCISNIVEDISNEIGPLTGPPPGGDIIPTLNTQIDALDQASKEENDKDDDDNDDNEKSSSASDSSSTAASSTASSSASSTSSAADSCPTYTLPDDDLSQWEGVPTDDLVAEKRDIMSHYPIGYNNIKARASDVDPIDQINSCSFPDGIKVTLPGYVSAGGLRKMGDKPNLQKGLHGEVYEATARWYVAERDCNASPSFKSFRDTDQSTKGGKTSSTPQSVDHVCKSHKIARLDM